MNCRHLAEATPAARLIRAFTGVLILLSFSFQTTAAQQGNQCVAGELPASAMPLDFVRPNIPLACWRAERESDGRGIFFKANFDVTPSGKTENIVIEYSDPACASEYLPSMIAELQYACSELGRKGMRFRMTISSPG